MTDKDAPKNVVVDDLTDPARWFSPFNDHVTETTETKTSNLQLKANTDADPYLRIIAARASARPQYISNFSQRR